MNADRLDQDALDAAKEAAVLNLPEDPVASAIRAYLAAIKSRPRPSEEAVEALWQDLLDKDDRTSGADYPDMALITFAEFRDYLSAIPHTGGEGWQSMDTAPKDGKHVLLCIKSGAFFYAVEGAFHGDEWCAAFCEGAVEPVYWSRKPTGFVLPPTLSGDA